MKLPKPLETERDNEYWLFIRWLLQSDNEISEAFAASCDMSKSGMWDVAQRNDWKNRRRAWLENEPGAMSLLLQVGLYGRQNREVQSG